VHSMFSGITVEISGDYLCDYFHNPSDTIYTLVRALPYLSFTLQQQTSSYIKSEFNSYPLYSIAHIGWANGVMRDNLDIPTEDSSFYSTGSRTSSSNGTFWSFPQDSFYGRMEICQLFPSEAKMVSIT